MGLTAIKAPSNSLKVVSWNAARLLTDDISFCTSLAAGIICILQTWSTNDFVLEGYFVLNCLSIPSRRGQAKRGTAILLSNNYRKSYS